MEENFETFVINLCNLLEANEKFIFFIKNARKHLRPKKGNVLHSICQNEAQVNYTTTEKELLVVVFAVENFKAYLIEAM